MLETGIGRPIWGSDETFHRLSSRLFYASLGTSTPGLYHHAHYGLQVGPVCVFFPLSVVHQITRLNSHHLPSACEGRLNTGILITLLYPPETRPRLHYYSSHSPRAVASAALFEHVSCPPDRRQNLCSRQDMSRAPTQPYASPTRPAYAVLQSSNISHSSSYSSSSSLTSQSSTASAPMAPSSSNAQYQQYYGSLNQQPQPQQQQQQQQRIQTPQRHPSFEYQPNRQGAGQTAAETARYLDQAALLAEAAKRAQMACVMRDIGEMEL